MCEAVAPEIADGSRPDGTAWSTQYTGKRTEEPSLHTQDTRTHRETQKECYRPCARGCWTYSNGGRQETFAEDTANK